jgi:hypothetical protein
MASVPHPDADSDAESDAKFDAHSHTEYKPESEYDA